MMMQRNALRLLMVLSAMVGLASSRRGAGGGRGGDASVAGRIGCAMPALVAWIIVGVRRALTPLGTQIRAAGASTSSTSSSRGALADQPSTAFDGGTLRPVARRYPAAFTFSGGCRDAQFFQVEYGPFDFRPFGSRLAGGRACRTGDGRDRRQG